MGTASESVQGKFCAEPGAAPHTFDVLSEPYEFVSETMTDNVTLLDTDGITGTREPSDDSRTREGQHEVGGTITMHPSPSDLDLWLPRILGTAELVDVFEVAETLLPFGMLIDKVGRTHEYTDCKINKATLRSSAGGFLEMELEIFGLTEALGTGYPVITLGTAANNQPYVHSDVVLTTVAAARDVFNLEIIINNNLNRRFVNSITANSLTPQRQEILVNATVPYTSDETALYDQAVAGVTATIKYTLSAMSLLFTFAILQSPKRAPGLSGDEVQLSLEMKAHANGATAALVVTSDSVA